MIFQDCFLAPFKAQWSSGISLSHTECYYLQLADLVQCAWCDLKFRDRTPQDDAWVERDRFAKTCPYLKQC